MRLILNVTIVDSIPSRGSEIFSVLRPGNKTERRVKLRQSTRNVENEVEDRGPERLNPEFPLPPQRWTRTYRVQNK